MIETKYLVIIGIIVCLLILYYFYDEISNLKKSFTPIYQKTMALEAKISGIEKLSSKFLTPNIANIANVPDRNKKANLRKIDSPVFSISYNSDMIKNGNLSVKYTDLSDSDAHELLQNIDKTKLNVKNVSFQQQQHKQQQQQHNQQHKQQQRSPQCATPCSFPQAKNIAQEQKLGQFGQTGYHILSEDLSDIYEIFADSVDTHTDSFINNSSRKLNISTDNAKSTKSTKSTKSGKSEKSDTININIADLIKSKEESMEYQKILEGLSTNISDTQYAPSNASNAPSNAHSNSDTQSNAQSNINSDSCFLFGNLDKDIIKSISESIQYADLPSDNILSPCFNTNDTFDDHENYENYENYENDDDFDDFTENSVSTKNLSKPIFSSKSKPIRQAINIPTNVKINAKINSKTQVNRGHVTNIPKFVRR